jgi:hypothetical protein
MTGNTMRRRAVILSGVVVLASTSCGGDSPPRTDTEPSGVVVTDSGGVRTVSLGRVESLSPPQLTSTLVHSTRQNDIELFYANAALFLPGGGVALANSGAREVLLLSDEGSLVTRAGRPGEGPGEFGDVTAMVGTADGFLVYDARMGRMNEFSRLGDFVTSWSFGSGNRIVDLKPVARGQGGEMLAVFGDSRRFAPSGIRRDTTPLLMYPEPEAAPDTLALLPATEWSYSEIPGGVVTRFEVGFGPTLVAFGFEDRAVLGETGSLDLVVHQADGRRTRRIHGDGGGGEVGADDVSAWRSERLAEAADLPPEFVSILEEIPHNETFPAFETAVLGPDEMVWIGLNARPGEANRAWLVIGPDGELRGRIDLPADAVVLAVDTDRIALVLSDETDVQDFQVHAY